MGFMKILHFHIIFSLKHPRRNEIFIFFVLAENITKDSIVNDGIIPFISVIT